jgi:hypothetical protein
MGIFDDGYSQLLTRLLTRQPIDRPPAGSWNANEDYRDY